MSITQKPPYKGTIRILTQSGKSCSVEFHPPHFQRGQEILIFTGRELTLTETRLVTRVIESTGEVYPVNPYFPESSNNGIKCEVEDRVPLEHLLHQVSHRVLKISPHQTLSIDIEGDLCK